jgi:hypothetical protein
MDKNYTLTNLEYKWLHWISLRILHKLKWKISNLKWTHNMHRRVHRMINGPPIRRVIRWHYGSSVFDLALRLDGHHMIHCNFMTPGESSCEALPWLCVKWPTHWFSPYGQWWLLDTPDRSSVEALPWMSVKLPSYWCAPFRWQLRDTQYIVRWWRASTMYRVGQVTKLHLLIRWWPCDIRWESSIGHTLAYSILTVGKLAYIGSLYDSVQLCDTQQIIC